MRALQILLLSAMALAESAFAQSVLVPAPTEPVLPPAPAKPATPPETSESGESFTPSGPVARPKQPFQWGFLTFHPHLSYQLTYGSGFHSAPGQTHKSFVNDISPGIGIDLGSHWNLDYTPTIRIYTDKNFRDSLDHSISLRGGVLYKGWALGLSQLCSLTSDPQVETASQTDQQIYSTSLSAGHQINRSLSVDLGASQNLRFTQRFQNSRDWSTLDWLSYHWGPSFTTALGAGFGYTDVQVGSDMTYEQLQARLMWQVTEKVSATVNGGGEIRQFRTGGASDKISPIFGVSLAYRPFEVTTISLAANRSVGSSYFANQVVETTSVSASVRQRFLEKYYLTLSGGYVNSAYSASAAGFSVTREDNHTFYRIALSRQILKRGNASVFYAASENSSNSTGFGYSSDQVGLQLSYAY